MNSKRPIKKKKKLDSNLLKTVAEDILVNKESSDEPPEIPDDDIPPVPEDGPPPVPEDGPPPVPHLGEEFMDEEPPPLPENENLSETLPPLAADELPALNRSDDEMVGDVPREMLLSDVDAASGEKKKLFKKKMPLGEILVMHGVISKPQLDYALKYQEENARDKKLGEILFQLDLIAEDKYQVLIPALMAQLQADKVHLDEIGQFIDFDLYTRFKLSQLEKENFFPLRIVESKGARTLDVFIENESDLIKMDDLAAIYSVSKVRAVGDFDKNLLKGLISEIKKEKASEIQPEGSADVSSITVLSVPDEEEVDRDAIARGREDNYISKIADKIIYEGVRNGASDIHIEYGEVPRVRYRVDGILQEGGWISPEDYPAVISRFKIMSELDISERRVPQDGNIRLGIEGYGVLDFRVNTIPVSSSEKICLRILDSSKLHSLTLDMIGLPDATLESVIDKITRPQGLVLITGPTGSGKSTTLYSSLIYLLETKGKEINICTAEDPIEYKLEGLNQTQLAEKVGLTFPKILKALLRQDPDVILVGEIRDLETGGLAIKASQTGHLVLSTLHTNTAVATIGRMVNMGIEPYLVADSVLAVINQRLARRVCKSCLAEYEPDKKELALLTPAERETFQFIRGEGCSKCNFKGYKGRLGFYEYLPMTRDLRRLINEGASEEELLLHAREEDFLTLREFGIMKAKEGLTTLEEVLHHTIDQFE